MEYVASVSWHAGTLRKRIDRHNDGTSAQRSAAVTRATMNVSTEDCTGVRETQRLYFCKEILILIVEKES